MKFNWGTGIFIFYTLFATSLFFQVYKSTQYDRHLVAENYYEKDLAYQTQYEKEANSLGLKEGMEIKYEETTATVQFQFPKDLQGVAGTVLFYRASDKKQDIVLPITLDERNEMILNTDKFSKGFWRIEVDWKANGKEYFDETAIKIKE